jgi:hypothetical protein
LKTTLKLHKKRIKNSNEITLKTTLKVETAEKRMTKSNEITLQSG